MDLASYIASLRESQEPTSYIELDREKEIAYMAKHKPHFERILQSIPHSSQSIRMLDVGTTPFTIFLKRQYPHYEVWTLDRTKLLEERCRLHGIHFRTCDLDHQALPFDEGYFDLVVFTEVLEHIFAPPSDVLKEMRRILREGGELVLSVPNIAALHKRIKLLLGVTPFEHPDSQMRKDWVHGHGHLHEYTMKEIVSLLKSCGFRIGNKAFVRAKVTDALRLPGHPLKTRLLRGAFHAAQGLWPAFGTEALVECYK